MGPLRIMVSIKYSKFIGPSNGRQLQTPDQAGPESHVIKVLPKMWSKVSYSPGKHFAVPGV